MPKSPTGKLTLAQMVCLWRLTRGGVSKLSDAQRIAGVKVHGQTARAAINDLDQAMNEALPITETIRCRGCGARLVSIPCVLCGPNRDLYTVQGPHHVT